MFQIGSSTLSCRSLIVLLAVTLLAACGFQPLYKTGGPGPGAGATFETIEVRPIADRVGQELRNHLFDVLTPRGQPVNPAWYLDVTLSESIEHIAVEQTSFSTRANLQLSARYELTSAAENGEEMHEGSVSVVSSYNILDSEYATLAAKRDARSRAVVNLSNDIRRQLAVWFNSQEP